MGRRCEIRKEEVGEFPLKNEETKNVDVHVELLFPANPDIATVVIIYANKPPQEFDVSKIFEDGYDKLDKTSKNAMR